MKMSKTGGERGAGGISRRTGAVAALALAFGLAGCAGVGGPDVDAPAPPGATPLSPAELAVVPAPPPEVDEAALGAWQALQAGNVGLARQRLGAAAQETDGDAALSTVAGFLDLLDGSLASARQHFELALQRDPGFAAALYGSGVTHERAGETATARELYDRALRADPTLVQAEIARRQLRLDAARTEMAAAAAAEERGDVEAAIESYRAALEDEPRLQRPYLRLAALLRAEGRDEEAIEVLRQGRRSLEVDAEYLRPLGQALVDAGAYAEALDVLERVQQARPDDAELAALVEEARRRYEEASMPEEYRRLRGQEVIDRADLAALVATGFDEWLEVREADAEPIIVDIDGSWAESYIREAVSWGVMEVFQNHGFLPDLPVTRGMLARVGYAILEAAGIAGEVGRPPIPDLPREHFLYRPVQAMVALGVLSIDAQGNFGDILEEISGEEAFQVLEGLRRHLRERVPAAQGTFAPPGGAG